MADSTIKELDRLESAARDIRSAFYNISFPLHTTTSRPENQQKLSLSLRERSFSFLKGLSRGNRTLPAVLCSLHFPAILPKEAIFLHISIFKRR